MKKNKIILSVVTASCLLFSGLTAAAFGRPEPVEFEKVQRSLTHAEPEQVTTNVLLRQILAEVVKANNHKGDNRCSDGEKQYSVGYVISTGKKTLRCDIGNGYPEWMVEDKA